MATEVTATRILIRVQPEQDPTATALPVEEIDGGPRCRGTTCA